MDCENKCQILKTNCFDLSKNFNQKVDIIFMDPPFKEKKVNNLIDTIVQLNYLRDNGLIIIHRNKKDNETLSEKLNIIEVRYYGLSKITFACY